jgi:hypothetical protein
MADTLRIKRRLAGGAAGPPASLAAAELAYNEQDDKLYYGKGNSGGAATSIVPIAGSGAFVSKSGDTMTGGLIIDTADPSIRLVKEASGDDVRLIGLKGSNTRWIMYLGDSTAESGTNNAAGSDFKLAAYDDAAVLKSTPIIATRATGAVAILGTNTNDSAAAGYVGEYKSASFGATALTTAVLANLTSVALTAGDWDVSAAVLFTQGTTTNLKRVYITLQTSVAANINPGFWTVAVWDGTNGIVPGTTPHTLQLGPTRVSLASSQTYYLNAMATFTVSTSSANGIMSARRIR